MILGFSLCWTADILDIQIKKAHNLKNNPTISIPLPKIYKKEVLCENLGQPDQKLAVHDGLHPVADAFSYLGL